jgi:hypothetical protein
MHFEMLKNKNRGEFLRTCNQLKMKQPPALTPEIIGTKQHGHRETHEEFFF